MFLIYKIFWDAHVTDLAYSPLHVVLVRILFHIGYGHVFTWTFLALAVIATHVLVVHLSLLTSTVLKSAMALGKKRLRLIVHIIFF